MISNFSLCSGVAVVPATVAVFAVIAGEIVTVKVVFLHFWHWYSRRGRVIVSVGEAVAVVVKK